MPQTISSGLQCIPDKQYGVRVSYEVTDEAGAVVCGRTIANTVPFLSSSIDTLVSGVSAFHQGNVVDLGKKIADFVVCEPLHALLASAINLPQPQDSSERFLELVSNVDSVPRGPVASGPTLDSPGLLSYSADDTSCDATSETTPDAYAQASLILTTSASGVVTAQLTTAAMTALQGSDPFAPTLPTHEAVPVAMQPVKRRRGRPLLLEKVMIDLTPEQRAALEDVCTPQNYELPLRKFRNLLTSLGYSERDVVYVESVESHKRHRKATYKQDSRAAEKAAGQSMSQCDDTVNDVPFKRPRFFEG